MKLSELLNIALVVMLIVVLVKKQKNTIKNDNTETELLIDTNTLDTTHFKKSIGKRPQLYAMPAMVVGSYDADGTPNIMSASWVGVVNSDPLSMSVSLRKSTKTYSNLMANQAFTLNVPSEVLTAHIDWIGHYSGYDVDKFDLLSLTPIKSEFVNAPYVKEFPLIIECKVILHQDLGRHTQFIGEVMDVKMDTVIAKRDNPNIPDPRKLKPIVVATGTGYFGYGNFLGRGGKIYHDIHIVPPNLEEIERQKKERRLKIKKQ